MILCPPHMRCVTGRQCYPNINFLPLFTVSESEMDWAGSPIMVIENHAGKFEGENMCSVSSSSIPLSSFPEAFQCNVFHSLISTCRNLLQIKLTSWLPKTIKNAQTFSEFHRTRTLISEHVSKSSVLFETFCKRCQHALNMGNKAAEDVDCTL